MSLNFQPLPDSITYADKYDPAMMITDQSDANAYFEVLVEHCLRESRSRGVELSREQACDIERQNLGYYADNGSHETRERVERLFSCAHPLFGPVANGVPTADECVQMAIDLARASARAGGLDRMNYILDEGGNPVHEPDLLAWCQWFNTADEEREIGKTYLHDGVAVPDPVDENDVLVSTVFLAKDHSMGRGEPILWETMIFGGPLDDWQTRYHTREEALRGHEEAVELAKAAVVG